jgi:cytochrome c-type biogenesis protein
VIDPVDAALRAAAYDSAYAYPLVFLAGVVTSIGPCVAPRYVALTALSHASAKPRSTAAGFVGGLLCGYVVLGIGADLLGVVIANSRLVYALLAVGLAVGGAVTLLRDGRSSACEGHAPVAGTGPSFIAGACSAWVVSPCCTPIVTILAARAAAGHAWQSGTLLLTFALGHATLLVAGSSMTDRLSAFFGRTARIVASPIVAGTLMLALAGYYGLLA